MDATDFKLEKAYARITPASIQEIRKHLVALKLYKQAEESCPLFTTVPAARKTFKRLIDDVGYNVFATIFSYYIDEINEFINEDSNVVTYLDDKAHIVISSIFDLRDMPYPDSSLKILNPHVGLTSGGYFARLSAQTAILTIYNKWICLLEKLLTFYR